ncbi:MAG: hypothetical protein WA364_13950 [Candidatus Nitrosopolaris sp.]
MDYSIGVIHKESFMTLMTDILVLRLSKVSRMASKREPKIIIVLGEILVGDDQKIHAEIDGGS